MLQFSQEKTESIAMETPLATEIQTIQSEIINLIEKTKSQSQRDALLLIATQVAHDIRSPLAAINTAILDLSAIPENKRIMIKNATKRINDIANNLLLHSKNSASSLGEDKAEFCTSDELIFVVLDNIISEKRYEYFNTDVNFQLNIANGSYGCFANINLAAFKRILSNLINNSIEATQSKGSVIINLQRDDKNIIIDINDNGCGIPHEILPKITNHGFSFKKENGAGLGLSYAKKCVERMKGEIYIQSKLNVGTKVMYAFGELQVA